MQMWVGRQRTLGQELQMSWLAHGQKISATLLTHSQLSETVHWQLSVTLVSFLMLVRDWIRWTRPRVQIAKSAITGNDIRIARLESAVLAVPVHFSFAVYHRAPGGVTISLTGRSSEPCYDRNGSDTNCQFRKGFRHDDSRQRLTRHHLSGGAQGPDPVQALLQAGPPDAVQPPPAAEGTLWCLVAADAGAVLRRIAAKRANVVLLNIFIS
jgi:hypothetical protein